MDMDSMHDSYATGIKVQNNSLIIVYDNLDKGVLGADGLPYYKNKRLTINISLSHIVMRIFTMEIINVFGC